MHVEKNKIIGIHYTISLENNETIFSTWGFEPEELIQGNSAIFPTISNALEGHKVGDIVEVIVEPSNAYGEKKNGLIYHLDIALFNNSEQLEVGSYIQVPGGSEALLLEKNKKQILVDANHPLAGEKLYYNISIAYIKQATEFQNIVYKNVFEIKNCSGKPGCC